MRPELTVRHLGILPSCTYESGTLWPASTQTYSHVKLAASASTAAMASAGGRRIHTPPTTTEAIAAAIAPVQNRRASGPRRGDRALGRQEVRTPDHPRPPVWPDEDVIEALRPLEIGDEHDRGDRQKQ